jgi:hypothetical protein
MSIPDALSLPALRGYLDRAVDAEVNSLPRATKPFTIESPIFIQQSVFLGNTDMLNDVINSIHDLTISYLIVSFKLDQGIGSGKKVKDLLSRVSTNSDDQAQSRQNVDNLYNLALKAASSESFNPFFHELDEIVNIFSKSFDPKTIKSIKMSKEEKQGEDSKSIISGRLVEIEYNLTSGQGEFEKSVTVKVPLLVRLIPRVFPDSIVSALISATIPQSFSQRYFQYKAGEISFFKDLVFQMDILRKKEKALKQDKSGTYSSVLFKKLENDDKKYKHIFLGKTGENNINLHNATFIFDASSLKKGANDAGIKFDNYASRQRFFNNTGSMFVLGVDQAFSMVDFYIDSIVNVGGYTFNQLKKQSNKTNMDILEIVKALQAGTINSRVI